MLLWETVKRVTETPNTRLGNAESGQQGSLMLTPHRAHKCKGVELHPPPPNPRSCATVFLIIKSVAPYDSFHLRLFA